MKTSMKELIEKLNDAQSYLLNDSEYAKGYDGALSDCINLAESYLQKEKEINTEMLEMLIDILDTIRECETPRLYEIEQLIKKATL